MYFKEHRQQPGYFRGSHEAEEMLPLREQSNLALELCYKLK
jgi:hypothetical protein